MTVQEFYRKRLVELSPDGIMNKINKVVDITTQVQICEEYHQYKLIISDVSGSYSVNDMDDAYDKGFKDAMLKYRE